MLKRAASSGKLDQIMIMGKKLKGYVGVRTRLLRFEEEKK